MDNCIFSAHCTNLTCDRSCPAYVETSYLLERNRLTFKNPVFSNTKLPLDKLASILKNNTGKLITLASSLDTITLSDAVTYCAICQNWQGAQLHCVVYHLRYSDYLDELKSSWSSGVDSESLEYAKIWTSHSKILIISNFDYVNFGDFESQTLLNILQARQHDGLTTVLVSPDINKLVSTKSSNFFMTLKSILRKTEVTVR